MGSTTEDENSEKRNYICIHCGCPVKELYKKYSPSVLKIINCKNCDEIADKYIEFEPMIIAIDVILLSKPAYKHLLYNTQFKIHWKLLVVFLLLEAYILYKTKYNSITLWDNQFAMEKLFYFCFGLVFVENIILFILLRISLMFTRPPKSPQQTNSETEFLLNLMKSITLANVSKFFQIPMLIWNKHTSDVGVLLNHALVMGYVVLALTQVYSVISCRGRCLSAFIVLIALCTKVMVSMKLESYLF